MSSDYRKLPMRPQAKSSNITGETRYWNHFKHPTLAKHNNKVTDVEFSPLEPYDFAVTTSTRVHIYDSVTCSEKKSLNRFDGMAYSGSYRPSDGKVLVAGCEDSKIRVCDLSSRVVLRTLVGHTAPVKAVRFLSESRFLLSGSDDHSVRTWDMTTEQNLDVLRGHTDYVRQVVEHVDQSAFCFFSASYDHAVRYWDRRISNRQGQACVFQLDQGAPVEDVLVLPAHSGDLIATAAENRVQLWSVRMAGGKSGHGGRVHVASNHQKTVTCLSYDLSTDRMISGGLDHMVKIYDLRPSLTGGSTGASAASSASAAADPGQAGSLMDVTHTLKYPSAILCAAISPDSRVLVVGMADGGLSIKTRGGKDDGVVAPQSLKASLNEDVAYSTPLPPPKRGPKVGTRAYFGRGAGFEPGVGEGADDGEEEEDYRVARVRKQKLAPYDVLLKGFKYHAALDAALATNRGVTVASMVDELINRNALTIALSGRDAQGLLPLLHFFEKFISNPSYAPLLLDLFHLVLDLYAHLLGSVPEVDTLLFRLAKNILPKEVEVQKSCAAVSAFVENVRHRAELRTWERDDEEEEEASMDADDETNGRTTDGDNGREQVGAPDAEDEEESEAAAPAASKARKDKRKAATPPSSASDDDDAEEETETTAAPKKQANGHAKAAAAAESSSDSSSEDDSEEEAAPKAKSQAKPTNGKPVQTNGKPSKKQKV